MDRSVLNLCRQYIESIYGDSFLIEQERMALSIYDEVINGEIPRDLLRSEIEFMRIQNET